MASKNGKIHVEVQVIETRPFDLEVGGQYAFQRGTGPGRRTLTGMVVTEFDGELVLKNKIGKFVSVPVEQIRDVRVA